MARRFQRLGSVPLVQWNRCSFEQGFPLVVSFDLRAGFKSRSVGSVAVGVWGRGVWRDIVPTGRRIAWKISDQRSLYRMIIPGRPFRSTGDPEALIMIWLKANAYVISPPSFHPLARAWPRTHDVTRLLLDFSLEFKPCPLRSRYPIQVHGKERPPQFPAPMSAYSIKPLELVTRLDTQAEEELESEICHSGLDWALTKISACRPARNWTTARPVPHTLEHLALARYSKEKGRTEKKTAEAKAMEKLFKLMELRACERAYERDITDPMGMGRLEVVQQELRTSESKCKELQTLHKQVVGQRDDQYASIAALETKLANVIDERDRDRAAATFFNAKLEKVKSRLQEAASGLEESNKRFSKLLEKRQQDQATITELRALLKDSGTDRFRKRLTNEQRT
ncbi:hypothetical protein B0H11DRAFT_1908565 [Mycena galericulata]|nr:hypothetical protein B0H11DRAFT_1908565 [Mycena galericulata]